MDHLASLSATILDSALKATALLALAWAGGFLLKDRSAAARHMLRAFVMAALLLLPFSGLLPAWRVRGIPGFAPAPSEAPRVAQVEHSQIRFAVAGDTMQPAVAEELPVRHKAAAATTRRPQTAPVSSQVLSNPAPKAAPASLDPSVQRAELKTTLRTSWWNAVAMVWLLGAGLFALRWAISVVRLWRLVRRAKPVSDHELNVQTREVAKSLELRRGIALLESNETDVPLAAGILHPAVILPPDYGEWSEVRRRAVLHHELAHIKRLDALAHVVAQAATVLYWFHPLAWLMVRTMRLERERACDDQVLAAGTKASDYAHELLDIVSSLRQSELTGAMAMARRSQLEGRVLAVLNPGLRRGAVSRSTALAVAAIVLGVAAPIAALRPAQQASTPGSPIGRSDGASTAPTLGVASAAPRNGQPVAAFGGVAYAEPRPGQPVAIAGEAADAAQASTPAPAPPASPASPVSPASPAPPAAPGGSDLTVCGSKAKMHNMSINSQDGHKSWTASWSGDDCSVELRAEGEIQFNADATDIQSVSSGGYFEVNVREGSSLRQIRVAPSANGLRYVLKVNGKEQPFDGEAKAWFSSFLLSLERATGFAADTRVPKLLATGGPTAVLDEINNLSGDYVRGVYFRKLLDQPNLSSAVVMRIINQASTQIGSDYEMARVLMEVSKQYELADETSRTAFLAAAGKLKSDYEHSRVLIALLNRPNISAGNVRLALESASSIKSDYEKSRILLSLMDKKSFEQSSLDFYLKLVSTITSDYEKSRDLLAPLQRYTLTSAQVDQIMDATSRMSSDYEKSRLLISLAGNGKFDEKQMTNYLKVIDSMSSDYERSRCLMSLMEHNKLSDAALARTVEAVSHIKSDYEKARVLVTVAGKYPLQGAVRESYIKAAESITSEYERNRALAGVVKRATL